MSLSPIQAVIRPPIQPLQHTQTINILKCVICLDRTPVRFFKPCRHLTACDECIIGIDKEASEKEVTPLCPSCNFVALSVSEKVLYNFF